MKVYEIRKCWLDGTVHEYGTWSEEEMKTITKGYKWNGMFYERKNSKAIIIVEEKKGE